MKNTLVIAAALLLGGNIWADTFDADDVQLEWSDLQFGAQKAPQAGGSLLTSATQTLVLENGNQQLKLAAPLTAYTFTFTLTGVNKNADADYQGVLFSTRNDGGKAEDAGIRIAAGDATGTYKFQFSSGNSAVTNSPSLAAVVGHEYRITYYDGIMYLSDWNGLDTISHAYTSATLTGGSTTLDSYETASTFWTNTRNNSVKLGQVASLEGKTLTAGQLKKIAYVPEPATATLSLLALAGLAARRRRK